MNAERPYRTPDEKRLFLLEKLKEEWEINPHSGRYMIGSPRYHQWIREAGIEDFSQLESYMESLRALGLIERFDFIPDYI